MRLDTGSTLLATLVVAAIRSSIATPYPVKYCHQRCSPKQIRDAFSWPEHLSDTKKFCRGYLNIPDVVVTNTKSVWVTKYDAITKTKTWTERPITLTSTNVEVTTTTEEQTSLATQVDVPTVLATTTIPTTTTTTITEITKIDVTSSVLATVTTTSTITLIDVSTSTSTISTTIFATFAALERRALAQDNLDKRNGESYNYAFKLPPYLPQDITHHDIISACKELKSCASTRTEIARTTLTVPAHKVISSIVKVTPTVITTITKIQAIVLKDTVTETTSLVSPSTTFETAVSTVTAVAGTTVTQTFTTGTITVTTGTFTSTSFSALPIVTTTIVTVTSTFAFS